MKKIILFSIMIIAAFSLPTQANKAGKLQILEKNQQVNQNDTLTATVTSSTRLFGSKDDLTSVIIIIPSGSTVGVLDSDSTYLHVVFEENNGYIFKRHAVINKTEPSNSQSIQYEEAAPKSQPVQQQQVSRFTYLESKYGSNMAAKIMAGKIWRGMDAEMVTDSWGTGEKTNRVISGNVVKEEWIYKNTWLYFENNILIDWGPVNK
ncbi:MAG TPA: hypothetical protein VIK07_05165 [Bacteroidales bacterium]